jgi:hypothetical protein
MQLLRPLLVAALTALAIAIVPTTASASTITTYRMYSVATPALNTWTKAPFSSIELTYPGTNLMSAGQNHTTCPRTVTFGILLCEGQLTQWLRMETTCVLGHRVVRGYMRRASGYTKASTRHTLSQEFFRTSSWTHSYSPWYDVYFGATPVRC